MSKMKQVGLMIVAGFLLSGCTLMDQINKQPARTPAQNTPERVVQESPTIEFPTLTPAYSPSPNSVDTQIAAERANNAEQAVIVDKRLTAVNLELTVASDNKTQTSHRETSEVGMIYATGTLAVISATDNQAERNFKEKVPTLIVAGTNSMYTGQKVQSEIGLNWLAGVAIFLMGVAFLCAILIPRKGTPASQDAQEDQQNQPRWIESETRTFAPVRKDGLGLHVSPPGNHAHFLIFAGAVNSGRKGFSKPEWEGADSPYNRQTYRVVYDFLWEYNFIELPPGEKIRWTAEGQEWVDNWIERNLVASPIEDETPISTDFTAEKSQAPEIQGPEMRGGGIGEVVAQEKNEESQPAMEAEE